MGTWRGLRFLVVTAPWEPGEAQGEDDRKCNALHNWLSKPALNRRGAGVTMLFPGGGFRQLQPSAALLQRHAAITRRRSAWISARQSSPPPASRNVLCRSSRSWTAMDKQ